jgi:signal transduction histidine kinase
MRYLVTLLLLSSLLLANTLLKIEDKDTLYTIGPYVSYLADSDDSLSIKDVQNSNFTPHQKAIPNFGFLSPTYWFKVQLTYQNNMHKEDWWLSIDYPLLDFVTLYIFDSKQNLISTKKSGDLYEESLKEIKQNKILFSLANQKAQTYTLYIKIQTSSSMLVPIYIMSHKVLLEQTHINQTLSGLYYGILLILILFNTITFFYTKEKIYALYVLFVTSYALWQLSFDGLGVLYFWGDFQWMKAKGTVFFIYTSTFALLLFSQALLKAKENIPKVNHFILDPLKYLTVIGIIAAIFLPYKYTIVLGALLAIIVPAVLFGAGLMVLKKDYYSIRLFVLGWGIFFIGTILFTLSKFNLIEGYLIMKYGQQIASAIEMILLSGALVQRFLSLRNEYTQKLKSHNEDLEQKVHIVLQKARQNDKILIEQSRLASMGEMIEQIAHQWRQPLNNIGLLNQDLYFKKILGTLSDEYFEKIHTQIDTNITYMSNTIDDFRTYYHGNREKEIYYLNDAIDSILNILEATIKHYKIKINLDIQDTVQVYNIKNELFQVFLILITNARDILISNNVTDKTITIKLIADTTYAYISVEDNGGGIDKKNIGKIFNHYFTTKGEDQGTGIGLYMSKTIIETNMHGKLSVKNIQNGASFTIKLPLYIEE